MAETGHAKNVEHFQMMISLVAGYGAEYAPSNATISLAQLNTALTAAQSSLDAVQAQVAPWKGKVAVRENIYKGIRPLSTRILAAADAAGMEENEVDNVRTYHRQIHGARAKALPADDPGTPEDESKGNSVSHQSYVQVAEAFGQMIKVLDDNALYNPAENDLKITALTTLHTAMVDANKDVIDAATPLSNARISRNETLYGETTGICDRAALVKKYVKSLYGAQSPQFEQLSGLKFTPPRTR
jgi:hypothetical protein